MTSNIDHIHIIGRYSQGQHTLVTSRSQGQCQGQEGRCRFFSRLYAFSWISPTFFIGEWLFSSVERSNGYVGRIGPCWAIYYQCWLNVADPTSLDVLVLVVLCAWGFKCNRLIFWNFRYQPFYNCYYDMSFFSYTKTVRSILSLMIFEGVLRHFSFNFVYLNWY